MLKALLYYIILIVIIGFIIRDAILASIELDMINISIILFQVFLVMLILTKGPLTQVGIIGWSIIFITKNLIPFIALLLEHHHDDFVNADISTIMSKLIKVFIAITFWVIASKISFEKK